MAFPVGRCSRNMYPMTFRVFVSHCFLPSALLVASPANDVDDVVMSAYADAAATDAGGGGGDHTPAAPLFSCKLFDHATVCTCDNGVPKTGSACTVNCADMCQSCNVGFMMNSKQTACVGSYNSSYYARKMTNYPPSSFDHRRYLQHRVYCHHWLRCEANM